MLKWFKELVKDWQAVEKELADSGIFVVPHFYGAVTYIDPELSTQINTSDDKHRTVPTDDRQSKRNRQV